MRKTIIIILLLFLVMLIIYPNKVRAAVIEGDDVRTIVLYKARYTSVSSTGSFTDDNLDNEAIKNKLKEQYGYNGEIESPIRIDTNVTVTKVDSKKNKFKVTLGNAEQPDFYTSRELKKIYGYEEKFGKLEEGLTWDITIGAYVKDVTSGTEVETNILGTSTYYVIRPTKIWSYTEKEDKDKVEPDESFFTNPIPVEIKYESLGKKASGVIDNVIQIKAWLEELGRDPIGTLVKALCKGVRKIFDSLQAEVNKFKTEQDGLPKNSKQEIMYSYEILHGDEIDPDTNINYNVFFDKYTKVDEFKNTKKAWQKKVYIENDEEEEGFSRKKLDDTDVNKIVNEGTNIPVIPVELYGMALGNIDLFSVDFINGSKANSNNLWNNLRSKFSLIVHIVLYISIAILIITLIYHGLSIVYGSIDPQKRADHMEGLKRFAFSLTIIVGTIIFMEICTYGSQIFFDMAKMTDEKGNITEEFPIRVNVNGVYSFSTNVTGYFRFMATSKNAGAQFLYTNIYAMLVLLNTFFAIVMFLRMIAIWFLGIIGPLLAVAKVLKFENKIPLNYERWIKWYLKLSTVQFLLALFYRVMLDTAIYTK